jgi:APA family basic amino acid/polyamine antiporter
MGYADVGADIYVALGVIAVWAAGASPLAFAIAAITYITTGLCYAELSTAYPVAGGGQYYSMKAFGRIHGFIAGWGLMLDYTIDIALFALVTVGYLGAVLEIVAHNGVLFTSPAFSLAAVALIVLLIGLNLLGIRNSSRLNETIVAFDLVTVSLFIVVGIPYIIYSGALQTWFQALIQDLATGSFGVPSLGWFSFVNAVTLAMVSFIGIESISQAAEETKKPERVIPSATKRAITSVTVVALALSLLSVSAVPWQTTAASTQDPTIPIAKALPVIGPYFYIWVALMGTLICYVSTNTGVIGVSRVTFSMGRLGLLPRGLARVSSRFRTPYVTIALFSGVAIALLLATSLLSGTDILLLVASLYNFGALVAYMYVNAAAIALRFKEPGRRSWKMPLNFDVPWKGVTYSVSAIPIVGFVSTLTVWILIVGTHPGGRELGIAWFAVGIVGYLIYQRKLKKEREA